MASEEEQFSNTLSWAFGPPECERIHFFIVDKSSVCGNLWLSLEVTQHLRAQSIVIAQ